MYLTVHASIGAVIGQHTASPLLAFILGFLSHYLADIIPHGDKKLVRLLGEWSGLKKFITIVVIDCLAMIITFFILLGSDNYLSYWSLIAGILGAILPDWGQGLGYLLPKTPLKYLYYLHGIFHEKIIKTDVSTTVGFFFVQVPTFIIFIVLFYLT